MIAIRYVLWRMALTLGALVLLASCGIEQSTPIPAPPTQGAPGASPPPATRPLPTISPTLFPSPTVPSQAPTLTPTLGNQPQPTALTITLADNGKTIPLSVGQRFLLNLGQDYDWTVTVDDPNIVSQVGSIAPVKGTLGFYEANKAGSTTLSATGVIICPPGQACIQIALEFRAQMVVK